MFTKQYVVGFLVALCAWGPGLSPAAPVVAAPANGELPTAQGESAQLQALLAKRSPSVVTVEVVIKAPAQAGRTGAAESRLEIQGIAVDAAGLVMIPYTPFSPTHLREALSGPSGTESPAALTPSDIRVVFEDEDKAYPAFLAATDTKTDLAFLKIEDLAGRAVTPVDFSAATVTPVVGSSLACVSRLRKSYDYAPYFRLLRVEGVIARPRRAWLINGDLPSYGLPVYTLAGDVAGVVSTVELETADEAPDTIRYLNFVHTLGGGAAPVPAFVIPASVVANLVTEAQQRTAALSAERAKTPPAGK